MSMIMSQLAGLKRLYYNARAKPKYIGSTFLFVRLINCFVPFSVPKGSCDGYLKMKYQDGLLESRLMLIQG